MESDEDPLLVKFLISSLEFEKLKYYETKCHELTAEIEKLKQNQLDQIGGGRYIVESNANDSLQTTALKEASDTEKPLINYGAAITKSDGNDYFDENALVNLVPEKNKFKAKCLLQNINERGSELTWNSSGIVFIDKISIPNTNFFIIFPHLFQNVMPSKEIPGLQEVVKKLNIMGLGQYIGLNLCSNENAKSEDMIQGAGFQISTEAGNDLSDNNEHQRANLETSTIASWWYIGDE